jgi:hypothetical protein
MLHSRNLVIPAAVEMRLSAEMKKYMLNGFSQVF